MHLVRLFKNRGIYAIKNNMSESRLTQTKNGSVSVGMSQMFKELVSSGFQRISGGGGGKLTRERGEEESTGVRVYRSGLSFSPVDITW